MAPGVGAGDAGGGRRRLPAALEEAHRPLGVPRGRAGEGLNNPRATSTSAGHSRPEMIPRSSCSRMASSTAGWQ